MKNGILPKKLSEIMDAECGVESVLGKGSRFWFTVPLRTPGQISEDLSPVDEVVLKELKATMGEDITSVIDVFLNEIDDLISRLQGALVQQDPVGALGMTRSLKSSSEDIGAVSLVNLARRIEAAVEKRNFTGAAALSKLLNTAREQLIVYFSEEAVQFR